MYTQKPIRIGKKKNQYEIEIHLKKIKIKSLQISVNVHIKICLTRVISRVRTVVELSLISISLPRHGQTNSQQTRRPKVDNVPTGFGDGAGCPGTELGVGRLTFPVKGMG